MATYAADYKIFTPKLVQSTAKKGAFKRTLKESPKRSKKKSKK